MFSSKKTILFSLLAFISFGFVLNRQSDLFTAADQQAENPRSDTLRKVKNESFKRGEMLKYRMHYGFINAGEAVLQVVDENKKIGERNTLHVIGLGYSNPSFDWIFLVRDRYESYIDEEAMIPWLFIRRVNEGGYKITQNYIFSHYKNSVDADGKKFDVPDGVQDMLSAHQI